MAVGSFYSTLEQGSKSNGKSTAWFGRKKAERRQDELLRYLQFARNGEEHGLKPITAVGGRTLELRGRGSYVSLADEGKGVWTITDTKGSVRLGGLDVALVRVCDDRFNDHCDPPSAHLGVGLADRSPSGIASLVIVYLEKMFAEASAL